jgi:hypothetical protein
MASQYLEKKIPNRIKAAKLLAKAFNTLDVSHLSGALVENAIVDGDKECDAAQGFSGVMDYLEKTINNIGGLHRPTIAEVARLEYAPRKYFVGVSVEMDDVPFIFMAVHTDKKGLIKVIYVHYSNPSPCDAELSGDRPGFNLAKYQSDKDCLWAIRKAAVKKLSSNGASRPHFVAVIHESQDPERILLVLDELTRNFDGSTCELLFASRYPVSNSDSKGDVIDYKNSADVAIADLGSVGFPTLGVMLNGECIRPGYRSWNPDEVISDLIRMGISKSCQFNEQMISVN